MAYLSFINVFDNSLSLDNFSLEILFSMSCYTHVSYIIFLIYMYIQITAIQ